MKRVHFVGIGGVGMSAIAKVLIEKGWAVSGSDMSSSPLTAQLEELGARVHIGHDAAYLNGAELVVRSSAIPDDNPEVEEAARRGIPVLHRSEMLAMLLNGGEGVAVAGAHGKTTITGMIATVLETAQWDPSVLVGGELVGMEFRAKHGSGSYVVAEADESDGSFLRYRPHLAVVTSVEADHLENYGGSFDNLVAAYRKFISNVKPGGSAVLGLQAARVLGEIDGPVVVYGLDCPTCHYSGSILRMEEFYGSMEVKKAQRVLGIIEVSVPGAHNLENALAAAAACLELGMDFDSIARGLACFRGVKRRFQLIYRDRSRDILIVDDYAHHPTELKATLRTAKDVFHRRTVAVFQPHRFNRTQFLFNEFAAAFESADVLLLAPIYSPPPEKPIAGVSSKRLAEAIRAASHKEVKVFDELWDIVEWLVNNCQDGDMILTLGAGNVWQVGQKLAEQLQSMDGVSSFRW